MKARERISEADLEWLNGILRSGSPSGCAMDVAALEGFLTALAIGPETVHPSQWLPWVWDFEGGEKEASFENEAQAARAMDLILGMATHVTDTLRYSPDAFRPVFYRHPDCGAPEWCEGFLKATWLFNGDEWDRLWAYDFAQEAEGEDGICAITPFLKLAEMASKPARFEDNVLYWVDRIVPSLDRIRSYWSKIRATENR